LEIMLSSYEGLFIVIGTLDIKALTLAIKFKLFFTKKQLLKKRYFQF